MKRPINLVLLSAGISAGLGSNAYSQNWTGTTNQDWATASNWNPANVPGNDTLTYVNIETGNFPIISTVETKNSTMGGQDLWIGQGAGITGRLDINAGGSLDTSGTWVFIGDGGGTGTVNVNSGGALTSDNQIRIGNGESVGNLNIDGGAVTVSALDQGGNSTANISVTNGGTLETTTGNLRMPLGTSSIDSGSIASGDQLFVGGGVGESTFTQTGGTISSSSWFPVGIGVGNVGTFTLSDGVVDVYQNAGGTTIGANGTSTEESEASIGIVNMTGGTFTVGNEGIIAGEQGEGAGTFNLDGGDLTTTRIRVGLGATTTGTFNLNGGTLSTGSFEIGAGVATVNLNGTPITANANSSTFFSGGEFSILDDLTVDTNGFDVSGNGDFVGTGNLTKNGDGSLSLTSDFHNLDGDITVNAGAMTWGAAFEDLFTGAITVADGAAFGVRTAIIGDLIQPSDLTFAGDATSLNINYFDSEFEVPTTPIIVDGGSLNVSGTTTINISGQNLASGTYTLIDYSGATKTGDNTWALGTLPIGVSAPSGIVDTGSTVEVDIIAPTPLWVGNVNGNWDSETLNWIDQGSMEASAFETGVLTTFDDTADVFSVTTVEDVAPSLTLFENSSEDYTLTADGGVITGSGDLTKNLEGNLTITNMANTYTGVTTFGGGTVTVDALSNGGVAGPLGAATSNPANLNFAGGALAYTGPATTFNRGFITSATGSRLINDNDFTLTGVAGGGAGGLTKSGAGDITFTTLGENTFGGANPGLVINEGNWTFDGSAGELGDQVINIPQEAWFSASPDVGANLNILNTVVNLESWVAMSRGNGGTGIESTLTIDGSEFNSGNFSSGFANGMAENNVVSNVNILNGSVVNFGALQNFSENQNAVTTVTVSDTSALTANNFIIGLGEASQADIILEDSATLTLGTNWTAIGAGYNGANANGTLTLNDSSSLTDSGGDFNLGDSEGGHGILNINDSATVNLTAGQTSFIGKGTSGVADSDTSGVINVNGGSFDTGGTILFGWQPGSDGTVNVTGGSFNQATGAANFFIGDQGNGILNIEGSGTVTAGGPPVTVGNTATATGTINLNAGGTLTANSVVTAAGTGTVNFDGGTLVATSASLTFLNTTEAVLLDGGGTINSDVDITAVTGLSGSGGFTKTGNGALTLSGANTYTGDTTVNSGILTKTAPDFADASTVNIASGGTLRLNYSGTDRVVGLAINGTAQPDGVYNSSTNPGAILGSGSITVGPVLANPYETWIGGFFPGETDPAIVGVDADPDQDGSANLLEFALGGTPDDASDNAKYFQMVADSDADSDTDGELLVTIAVRSGTPAFAGAPSPTATNDGVTYTVTGSVNLVDFAQAVSVAPTPVMTDLADAPDGYEYRTFSLDSSNGLTGKGFLRVAISE